MKKYGIKIKKKIVVVEEELLNVGYVQYIAIKIREYRKEKGFTQQEFADKVGISRVSITSIETSKHLVSFKNLQKICEVLDVKSSKILPF